MNYNMFMEKNELRKKYKLIRKEIIERELKNKLIFDSLISNNKIQNCNNILSYISFNDEIDTINFLKYFINKKNIYVPKISKCYMEFYKLIDFINLKPNSFNILEPTNNETIKDFTNSVCITPGIIFDIYGNRIGYGKGYYDKFFNDHNVYKIGVCYDECLYNDLIDTYTSDCKVDEIITPTKRILIKWFLCIKYFFKKITKEKV